LGRTDQEKDTFWAVEANENFYMKRFKRTFSERQGLRDAAELVFMALKYIFDKTFTEGRLSYAVFFFFRGCK